MLTSAALFISGNGLLSSKMLILLLLRSSVSVGGILDRCWCAGWSDVLWITKLRGASSLFASFFEWGSLYCAKHSSVLLRPRVLRPMTLRSVFRVHFCVLASSLLSSCLFYLYSSGRKTTTSRCFVNLSHSYSSRSLLWFLIQVFLLASYLWLACIDTKSYL